MDFNWQNILFGTEEWSFIFEVILRTGFMFCIIVAGLRILGKRSVKQLSIFELVVIVGLGSAAGDPMIQKDAGIVFSLAVFGIIILLYSILTFFIGKCQLFERIMEGTPTCLIQDGRFSIDNFKKEKLGTQELHSALRTEGVTHLGQVETALEEMSGEISTFFYEDKDVKFGMPIMPDLYENKLTEIKEKGHYSCEYCGYTEIKEIGVAGSCKKCSTKKWIKAINKKRVT